MSVHLNYPTQETNTKENSNNDNTEKVKAAASALKWPSYITSDWFKRSSNAFIGVDQTLVLKSFISIRVLIGIGVIIAAFLPFYLSLALASVLLLPSLLRTLLIETGLLKDGLKERIHPLLTRPYTASVEGDFCVFIIGAKQNTSYPSAYFKWSGDAFQSMIKELEGNAEKYGYMGGDFFMSMNPYTSGPIMIQYWRSQEQLNAWAKNRMNAHVAPMLKASRHTRESTDYGIFHESYRVHAGEYDCIYMNMPRMLLGKVGEIQDSTGKRRTAAGRANLPTVKEDEQNPVYAEIDSIPIKTRKD